MRLNNKGQSLVMFILILPVILFILLIVYDIGNVIVEKQKLNNINSLVMDYGLDNINNELLEEKVKKLIILNDKEIDEIKLKKENDIIYLRLSKNVDIVISGLIKEKIINISSTYKGTIKENKKNIERVK